MDIQQLNQVFQQGAYQDYNLKEYQFMRRFCELTKPKTITCVGGGTNLDVFYATQGQSPTVVNWDPGMQGVGKHQWPDLHEQYQKATDFKGKYEWIPTGVSNIKQINTEVDLLWFCWPADYYHLLEDMKQWPRSMVVSHYGDILMTPTLVRIHRHLPIRAVGKRITVFCADDHDLEHPTYHLQRTRGLGPIKAVTEIIR